MSVCVLAGAEPAGVPHTAARQVLLAAVSPETTLGGFDLELSVVISSGICLSYGVLGVTFSAEQVLGH